MESVNGDIFQRILEVGRLASRDVASLAMTGPCLRAMVSACPTAWANVVMKTSSVERHLRTALRLGARSLSLVGDRHNHSVDALIDVARIEPECVRRLARITLAPPSSSTDALLLTDLFPALREIVFDGQLHWSIHDHKVFLMDPRVACEVVKLQSDDLVLVAPRLDKCELHITNARDVMQHAAKSGKRIRSLSIVRYDYAGSAADQANADGVCASIAAIVEEELTVSIIDDWCYQMVLLACARRRAVTVYRLNVCLSANLVAMETAAAMYAPMRIRKLRVDFNGYMDVGDMTPLRSILRDRVVRFSASIPIGQRAAEQAEHLADAFVAAAPTRIEGLHLTASLRATLTVLRRMGEAKAAPALRTVKLNVAFVLNAEEESAEAVGQALATLPALETIELCVFSGRKWLRIVADTLLRAVGDGHPLRQIITPGLCLVGDCDTLGVSDFRRSPVPIAYP